MKKLAIQLLLLSILVLIGFGIRAVFRFFVPGVVPVVSPASSPSPTPSEAFEEPPSSELVFHELQVARSSLEKGLQKPGAGDREKASRLVSQAQTLPESEIDKRAKLFNAALDLDPRNTDALGALAWISMATADPGSARAQAASCLAIDPRSSDCQAAFIHSYTHYSHFDKVQPYVERCLAEQPDNVHCLSALMGRQLYNDQLDQASDTLQTIVREDPSSKWSLLARGTFLEQTRDLEGAKTAYSRACESGLNLACQLLADLEQEERDL